MTEFDSIQGIEDSSRDLRQVLPLVHAPSCVCQPKMNGPRGLLDNISTSNARERRCWRLWCSLMVLLGPLLGDLELEVVMRREERCRRQVGPAGLVQPSLA